MGDQKREIIKKCMTSEGWMDETAGKQRVNFFCAGWGGNSKVESKNFQCRGAQLGYARGRAIRPPNAKDILSRKFPGVHVRCYIRANLQGPFCYLV